MKKVIDGRLYSTDTAKMVGEYQSREGRSSFSYYEEQLYQKRTGEFFLYGYGHAASPYSERIDRSTRGPGSKIVPLTFEEAKRWAEEKLCADEYEKIFGIEDLDEKRVAINLSLSASDAAALKRAAQEAGMTVSAYVADRLIRSKE